MLGVSRYQGCDRSVSGVSPAVVVGTKVVLSNEHFVIFQVQVFCETKYKQLWVSRVHYQGYVDWKPFRTEIIQMDVAAGNGCELIRSDITGLRNPKHRTSSSAL